MVHYHQLSVIFVRVWRCFIRIMRSYLRYCILAQAFLFCYGICDSLNCLFVTVNFIVLCLLTLTLWIEFSFRIEPWLIHSLWIGIVHGILFDISGWYHRIWWILYTCKVIKGNTCAYLGLLGVACSPILSVSLEEVGCEPVLNLAATPDEAVSIICTVVDKTILSTYW